MTRHLHFYFSSWQNESRAWRSGSTALEHGFASEIIYVGHKVLNFPDIESLSEDQIIKRIGGSPDSAASSRLKRIFRLPGWWWACLRQITDNEISLVIAHSLAALPIGVFFSRKNQLPLLYDAHELETERNGWNWLTRRFAKLIESTLIRFCDHVVVVNDSIRDFYLDLYPELDISVVRNVPVKPQAIGKSNLRIELGIPDGAIVYVYCGVIGAGRCLYELIEVFCSFGPDRHLVMIGDGADFIGLVEKAKGLTNVHFYPAVPQEHLVQFLTGADIGLVILEEKSLSYKLALPNKVFEYALAGLSICVSDGPELIRFAKSYPGAKVTRPTINNMKTVLSEWTREEIRNNKKLNLEYPAPTWQLEKSKLIFAFEKAVQNGAKKWKFAR